MEGLAQDVSRACGRDGQLPLSSQGIFAQPSAAGGLDGGPVVLSPCNDMQSA